jgi:hypothetical protein
MQIITLKVKNQKDYYLLKEIAERLGIDIIEQDLITKTESKENYLEMLLQAPTMSEEQFVEYEKNRKRMSKWRRK